MNLPDYNNVYGSFVLNGDLDKLGEIFRREYSNSLVEIGVRKSDYDGVKNISITDDCIDFESRKLDCDGTYSFSGAVGGDFDKIMEVVGELYAILKRHGYSPRFEIYNEQHECIGEYNS